MSAQQPSLWSRFWHQSVRAERLGLMRLLLGGSLLADQLLQYLPNLLDFFGDTGAAPQGLFDAYQLQQWRWTLLFFHHDRPEILYSFFALWVAVTLLWTIGFATRWTNLLTWLLTLCWVNRNPNLLNGADDTLVLGLFLLLLSPCGKALSIDAWLQRRRSGERGPITTAAWPVCLLQIQLCCIYATTGLVKLFGDWEIGPSGWPLGTWWQGTSIHYALNYVTMSRWSYAWLPVPLWITAPMTWASVLWEAFFPLLVLSRWLRPWVLLFGVLFHLGIWLTIEVGWFSFYMLSFYGVWVADSVWSRFDRV